VSAAGYAGFLRLMGHRLREEAGVYWFNVHSRIYMSFPFQTPVDPDSIQVRKVLGRDGLVLRHTCPLGKGRLSYRIAINEAGYDLQSLTGKARNQTRRGLERCRVQHLDFASFTRECVALNRDTLLRQGRAIPSGFDDYWQRYYGYAGQADGAQIWGAFFEGELAAYLISFEMEGVAHILILRSKAELLRHYPNNALLFSYMKSVLGSGSIREVSIGLESIQCGMDSLDRFKTNMGFQKVPVGQCIAFTPWLRPFVAGRIGRVVRSLVEQHRGNERIDKMAGMLRWYAEQESAR